MTPREAQVAAWRELQQASGLAENSPKEAWTMLSEAAQKYGNLKPLDPAALARLRSAWLDPEVSLTDIKTRFRVQTKDYPTLRAMFGERPDTNLLGRQRVWKEKRA